MTKLSEHHLPIAGARTAPGLVIAWRASMLTFLAALVGAVIWAWRLLESISRLSPNVESVEAAVFSIVGIAVIALAIPLFIGGVVILNRSRKSIAIASRQSMYVPAIGLACSLGLISLDSSNLYLWAVGFGFAILLSAAVQIWTSATDGP